MPIYHLGLNKTNFPGYRHPVGQRGQRYPQLALGPVPDFDFGVGYAGFRTTFSHKTPPSSCTQVSRKNEFSPNIDPAGSVTTGPFYHFHTVPSLNFAWYSRGIPLLGTHGTGLLCPFTPWVKGIISGYRSCVGQKGATIPTSRTRSRT